MKESVFVFCFISILISMQCFGDESLSVKQKEYYNWIIIKSGESNAKITSGDRTAKRQVTIMWDNCITKSGGSICKLEFLANGYDKTCSIFMTSAFDSSKGRDENILKMSTELEKGLLQLGGSRLCMQHVVVPGIERINRAIDVSAKSESVKNHATFYDAVMHEDSCVDKSRFFYPDIPGKPKSKTPDKAFHLEFRLDDSCPK